MLYTQVTFNDLSLELPYLGLYEKRQQVFGGSIQEVRSCRTGDQLIEAVVQSNAYLGAQCAERPRRVLSSLGYSITNDWDMKTSSGWLIAARGVNTTSEAALSFWLGGKNYTQYRVLVTMRGFEDLKATERILESIKTLG